MVMGESAVCTKCGTKKALVEFYRNSKRKNGRQAWCKQCIRKAASAWMNAHYQDVAEKYNTQRRFNRSLKKEKINEYRRKRYRESALVRAGIAASRTRNRALRARYRSDVVNAYGGRCTCCGESESTFLTLEHKNRDGSQHRVLRGDGVWLDVIRLGFPERFTILCMNCNWAERHGQPCPHKTRPKFIVVG